MKKALKTLGIILVVLLVLFIAFVILVSRLPDPESKAEISIEDLFLKTIPDAIDVQPIIAGNNYVFIYTTEATYWDESDFVNSNLTDYINFCREAYNRDEVALVTFKISTPMTDSRGNEEVVSAMNIEMEKEVFLSYNWDNVKLNSVYFQQIYDDCATFWVTPGIWNNVDFDRVYYK